jgi:antitoxin (DNA-binding transcriptional repressor) of toxin-antitoxin stability system
MAEREPMTQTINVTEARQTWSAVLNRVFRHQVRVVVEKSGISMAAIIPMEDLERFNRLEQERAHDFAILDEIGEAFRAESPEESTRLATQAVADTREAHRAQQATPKA